MTSILALIFSLGKNLFYIYFFFINKNKDCNHQYLKKKNLDFYMDIYY